MKKSGKKKKNQKELRIGKVIKKKETNYMSNGKAAIIHLIAGLIKEMLHNSESILS